MLHISYLTSVQMQLKYFFINLGHQSAREANKWKSNEFYLICLSQDFGGCFTCSKALDVKVEFKEKIKIHECEEIVETIILIYSLTLLISVNSVMTVKFQ